MDLSLSATDVELFRSCFPSAVSEGLARLSRQLNVELKFAFQM